MHVQETATSTRFPAGAYVRVKDICFDSKTGKPGILPIHPSTWYLWVRDGRVPQGRKLGPKIRAWSIETVLAVGAAQ